MPHGRQRCIVIEHRSSRSHSVFAAIGAGIGYDIPINNKNSVWLSPEAFIAIRYNLGNGSSDLKVSTLRIALAVKSDIGAEPPHHTAAEANHDECISKRILPNGETTGEPVIPEQASRTRSSVPLLPYNFLRERQFRNSGKIFAPGATGFSEMNLKEDEKMRVDANHELLGYRFGMKQIPNENYAHRHELEFRSRA